MTVELVTDLLLASLVIALSPIPIIAITLVLGTARARANGLAFSTGWVAGLLAVTAALLWLTDGAEARLDGATRALDAARIGVGLLLLALAAGKWRRRPGPGEEAALPDWMRAIDQIAPGRALLLGLALAAANPKNLAFALVAAAAIAGAEVVGREARLAVLLFVALGSLSVLGALAYYLVATDRAAEGLARLKDFMARNNLHIMAALFAIFGLKLLFGGLAALLGR